MANPTDQFAKRPLPPKSSSGLFSERPLPSAPVESAPAAPSVADVGARPTRWAIPLLLFVAIIGGIAWLAQNMRNWREDKRPAAAATFSGELFRFPVFYSHWEKPPDTTGDNVPDPVIYVREYERGEEGKYWYPFKNVTEHPVTLGLGYLGCDCSRLEAALISEAEYEQIKKQLGEDFNPDLAENPAWQWQPMKVTEVDGFDVPPGGHGLVRMLWTARKEPGGTLNLKAILWARSPKVAKRQGIDVMASAIVRRPVEVRGDKYDIGDLGPNEKLTAKFTLWSATRDEVEVKVTSKNRLFEPVIEPLTKDEIKKLEEELRNDRVAAHIRCGYRVTVTVHEQKGDEQMPQGPLYHPLDVEILGGVGDAPRLLVYGLVRGDVQVGGDADRGRVQLKIFRAADGIRKSVVLLTEPHVTLNHLHHAPGGIEVKLKEDIRPNAVKRRWILDVNVPPNAHIGPFEDEHAIILETGTNPRRKIRIPIVGNAAQG
jgi:hypothetical protein